MASISPQFEQLPLFGKDTRKHLEPAADPAPRWSGQKEGQFVLPPDLSSGPSLVSGGRDQGPRVEYLSHDRHGNVQEAGAVSGYDESNSIEDIYNKRPRLMNAARMQPITSLRTDSPVHTLQQISETETMYDLYHGPEHRKQLDANIASEGVREPVQAVKHQNRLILIDGHHRMLAARKAGQTHVPVQIFDHDAHVASGKAPIIEPITDDMGFGSRYSAFSGYS